MILTEDVVFWVFAVLAAVAVVTYIGRVIEFRRAQIDYQDFLKGVVNVLASGGEDEALAICDDALAPVAQVVATAILHRRGSERILREAVDSKGRAEVGRLDRRLATLAIIAQVAPLLGLLGTIVSFSRTVLAANAQAIVVRADLVNGTMEALVSAALGLAVAIPTTVMYGSLRVRLDRIVVEMEAAASQIVGYLTAQREKETHR